MATKVEKNYWPHAIVIAILLMVVACGYTIKIAMANPVELDSFYLAKYQHVENNINEILEKQRVFDKNYIQAYKNEKFIFGDSNKIELTIKDIKTNKPITNAKVKMMITRPDTNKYNQKFETMQGSDGKYIFKDIKIHNPGRWQILTRISINGSESFNQHEIYVKNHKNIYDIVSKESVKF